MTDYLRYRIPIRTRLTLWYLFLMAVTFILFAVYLLARFQNGLISALDTSLKITVSKTIAAMDEEDLIETGKLTFDNVGQPQPETVKFAMRVISSQGMLWDTYGTAQNESLWGTGREGYSTQSDKDSGEEWRTYSQSILDTNGQIIGFVQAAQSLDDVLLTMQELRSQLLFGIPLLLLFAGFGGYLLSNRALHPIQKITQTAQEISARDLSRRLEYQGPQDEIGRLAHTFDQMLERLQSAFEHERRFTSDAAHELRTPLTILKGQIEVTLNRPRNSSDYEMKLQELLVQVERLIRLSNALLFMSRSDHNELSLNKASLNLKELLDVIVEQFQPIAHEKGVTMHMQIPNHLPVYGDTDQLTRLFVNLLDNAVKYTPADGLINMEAWNSQGEIQATIHNSGAGISAQHLPHMFERFYRVDADRSSQSGGTGLGLSIAREIVRLHGGKISISSEAGNGVKLTVSLPANTSSTMSH